MLRILEEFLWMLRRHGFSFGPAQAADAARAIELIGWEEEAAVRSALALVLLQKREDQARFDKLFYDFFRAEKAHSRDLFRRLEGQGLQHEDVEKLRGILEAFAQHSDANGEAARLLLGRVRGAALDESLAIVRAQGGLDGLTSRRQIGYFSQKILGDLRFFEAPSRLSLLRSLLIAELGEELGSNMTSILQQELDLARSEVRLVVEQEAVKREGLSGQGRGFEGINPGEVEEVRRAVRVLGEKLRGAARVRERRQRHGKVDARRTLRASMRWGGVPVRLLFRRRERQKPKLWVLCDVSESVRAAALFLLEFSAITQDLFERSRTFVFVSEIVETSELFASKPIEQALSQVLSGGVIDLTHNSNYGRALRSFEQRFHHEIDRQSTIVIVGDGRGNFQDAAVDVVERLRERARAVLWLCPESREQWGIGDSAMPRYVRAVTEVFSAMTARDLEAAARALVRRR